MLTPEQIKERLTYIGSTDAAAILGMSRWKSPLDVWCEKTGTITPEDISKKLPIRVGHKLEQVVAELFMEETGKKVQRVNETVFHPKYPFIAANLDRRVVGENAVLEIKTASNWKANEWEEEDLPADYAAQVLHQLAVTGYQKGYLAVLIGGNQDFKIKEIHRDEKVIEELIKKEVTFWNDFVVPKVMPEVSARDRDTLQSLFPEAKEGKTVDLDSKAIAICEIMEGMEQDLNHLTRQYEKNKNALRQMLGDAEIGKAGAWEIKWGNYKSRRLNIEGLREEYPQIAERFYKESNSRRFTVKKNA